MKNGEIIERFQSSYSKGVSSSSSRLEDEFLYNTYLTIRALFVRTRTPGESFYQVLKNIEMELTESYSSECDAIYKEYGCKVYRSKKKLPKMISDKSGYYIKGLYNFDRSKHITSNFLADVSEIEYISMGRYADRIPKFFIQDEYLYSTSKNIPRVLELEAIFFDPYEVEVMGCKDKCVDLFELDTRIDHWLIEEVINYFEKKLQMFVNMPEDQSNDASDTREQTTK